MKKKQARINIRADEDWVARLERVAKFLERPASQFVREAVNEKIESLAKRRPALREALEQAA
jgi:predicted DNA-binding protein